MNIGGRAFSNGIMLQVNETSVVAKRIKDNSIQVKVNKLKINQNIEENIIKKIPIVRGIYSFLFTNGNIVTWIIFGIIVLLDILKIFSKNSYINSIYLGVNNLYYIAFILFIVYIFIKLKDFLQYHGAEHKVVNAYEKEIPMTINDIKKCSRVNYRCGTIYAIFFILSCIISSILLFKYCQFPSVILLLAIGIAEELFNNKFLYKIGFKYLFVIGGLMQKYLTTMEPTEDQLEVGIVCLNKLLEIENG